MGAPEPSGDLWSTGSTGSTGSSKTNIGTSRNQGCKHVSSGRLRRVQESSGEPQRVQEENSGELRRVQEHLGKARRVKEGQGGPGDRLKLKKNVYHQF